MSYAFHTDRTVTARKSYTCNAGCCQPIMPGERHSRYAGSWDGSFYDGRMHEDCFGLHEGLRSYFDPDNDGMDFSTLEEFAAAGLSADERQDMLDEFRGFYPHAVCRLEFAMRNWR